MDFLYNLFNKLFYTLECKLFIVNNLHSNIFYDYELKGLANNNANATTKP